MKKGLIFVTSIFVILFLASVSAVNLDIKKEIVNDVVISELTGPAIFNFSVTNLGESDNFEIYTLVGAEMSPKGMFQISAGETKKFEVSVYPSDSLKRRSGLLTFSYKMRGQNTGIQEDTLTINIVDLKDAFDISIYNLNSESESATAYIENKVNYAFSDVKVKFESTFFSIEKTLDIDALKKKEIDIPVNQEKLKKLIAGEYLLTTTIIVDTEKETFENTMKLVEKSGVLTRERSSGFFLKEKIIEKVNEGNTPTIAEISVSHDIISRLFTAFSSTPNKVERKGLTVTYSWFKELRPAETLAVRINTNYLYPVLILFAIIIGLFLIQVYLSSDLILRKRVSHVKTKGGEFALKITITAHAKRFVEKISLIDRLPAMVKIFERFGANPPHRIDEYSRRLEWDIESLQPGEERIFSYIVYSKIGVFGKFELPPAAAIYERDGKIKETESNLAFFMSEPRKRVEE